jgi:hypothetical protein
MKTRIYYTSNVTLRQVLVLFCIIGINVLFLEAGHHNAFSIGALICFHSFLFGKIAVYMAEGIFTRGIMKRVYTLVSFLLFLSFTFLNIAVELAVTGTCALVMAAALLFRVHTPGKMNGDNDQYSETDIDKSWFDTVDDLAYEIRVSFPQDIGCCKADRLEGTIEALGRAAAGKYEGKEAALVTSMGKRYLCPIRNLKPAELTGGDGGVVIASNSTQEVLFISWKDGKKASGVFYVMGKGCA